MTDRRDRARMVLSREIDSASRRLESLKITCDQACAEAKVQYRAACRAARSQLRAATKEEVPALQSLAEKAGYCGGDSRPVTIPVGRWFVTVSFDGHSSLRPRPPGRNTKPLNSLKLEQGVPREVDGVAGFEFDVRPGEWAASVMANGRGLIQPKQGPKSRVLLAFLQLFLRVFPVLATPLPSPSLAQEATGESPPTVVSFGTRMIEWPMPLEAKLVEGDCSSVCSSASPFRASSPVPSEETRTSKAPPAWRVPRGGEVSRKKKRRSVSASSCSSEDCFSDDHFERDCFADDCSADDCSLDDCRVPGFSAHRVGKMAAPKSSSSSVSSWLENIPSPAWDGDTASRLAKRPGFVQPDNREMRSPAPVSTGVRTFSDSKIAKPTPYRAPIPAGARSGAPIPGSGVKLAKPIPYRAPIPAGARSSAPVPAAPAEAPLKKRARKKTHKNRPSES